MEKRIKAEPSYLPTILNLGRQAIPIKWMKISYYEVSLPQVDREMEYLKAIMRGEEPPELPAEEAPTSELREVWAPVLPPQYASNPQMIAMAFNNLYYTVDGQNPTRMTPDDVTASGLSWEQFVPVQTYFSLAGDIAEKGVPEVLDIPEVKDYIVRQAQLMAGGEQYDPNMYKEIAKIQASPDYIDKLRLQGKAGGELGIYPEADIQEAQALNALLTGATRDDELGARAKEEDRLKMAVERLTPRYEEFKKKVESGLIDPNRPMSLTEQMGLALMENYEIDQRRLREIESAALQQKADIGEAGWDIAGPSAAPPSTAKPGTKREEPNLRQLAEEKRLRAAQAAKDLRRRLEMRAQRRTFI